MTRSTDAFRRCSAVLEYIKSLDEVEREMYEKFKERMREKNYNETKKPVLKKWKKIVNFPEV
jgi:hypothetical protein